MMAINMLFESKTKTKTKNTFNLFKYIKQSIAIYNGNAKKTF